MTDGVRLFISGVTDPDGVVWRDVEETHAPLHPRELARTVNGRVIALPSRRTEKLAISLSAAGDRVYPPGLDVVRPGHRVTLHSSVWLTLRQGAVLRRPAVPKSGGGTYVVQSTGLNGRLLQRYRPVVDCVVVGWGTTGSATDRQTGWTLNLEEY